MASQWYCQIVGEQVGPVLWSDMVEMIRSGTLGPSDLVRQEESRDWETAESVVGLFRAAKLTPETTVAASDRTPRTAKNDGATNKQKRPRASTGTDRRIVEPNPSKSDGVGSRRRWLGIRIGVGVLIVAAGLAGFWASRSGRFPAHRLTAESSGMETPSELLDVPVPEVPSVPDLPGEVATPLPGLEHVPNAFSPALSGDLKTIVFAHFADAKTGYDLYLATRDHVGQPFGPPKLIAGAQSPECDAYPTLSSNSCELIFARSDDNPRLLRCVRPSVDAEFGVAEECLDSTKLNSGERVGLPQLFFDGSLCFMRQQIDPPTRSLWMATRTPSGLFEPKFLVACSNPWLLWCISANGQRAYSGSDEAVVLTARESPAHPFGSGVAWAETAETGPIDGPLWVSPHEDVIVYSSAGPGKKLGSSRQLWMWRKGNHR